MSLISQKLINGQMMTLFAVCVEVKKKTLWEASVMYTHAVHRAAAKFTITQALSGDRLPFRIVDVAPAIGWHVQDNHGEKLAG